MTLAQTEPARLAHIEADERQTEATIRAGLERFAALDASLEDRIAGMLWGTDETFRRVAAPIIIETVSGGALEPMIALAGKYAKALEEILYLRPGGPCHNKMIEQMENIARDALHG